MHEPCLWVIRARPLAWAEEKNARQGNRGLLTTLSNSHLLCCGSSFGTPMYMFYHGSRTLEEVTFPFQRSMPHHIHILCIYVLIFTSFDPKNRQVLNYANNEYFRFRYTDTNIHCSHRHPQLRNLVVATSKNDVYYLCMM